MVRKLSVSFVIGFSGSTPIGGLRIIYEYANRLADRGWKVRVIHAARLSAFSRQTPLLKRLRFQFGYYRRLLFGMYLPSSWFRINPKVKMLWTRTLEEKYIPDGDIIIACPVETASFVNSYSPAKGKKFYFIQHFEDWTMAAAEVEKTWKMPLQKIVISRWLLEKSERLGENAFYIPNGLDPSNFRIDIPFRKRYLKSILFLSHNLQFKGTKYVVEAAKKLIEKYPDLKAVTFGVYNEKSYPPFITCYQNPPQKKLRELYNQARIFISPSLSEGWALPPAEAMMCGCIVIATDIGGHEYIHDHENGLLCAVQSPDSIVEKVEWVFNYPDEAEKIAIAASQSLKEFDWDSRVSLFEQALNS